MLLHLWFYNICGNGVTTFVAVTTFWIQLNSIEFIVPKQKFVAHMAITRFIT